MISLNHMQEINSVANADVTDKRVLVRADFNVPLKDGAVVDDLRIRTAVPTIELLHQNGASKIVILSSLGRPEGKVVESLRMAPVEAKLRELTKAPFEMHENLRFDPREEANDEGFAKELASLGDVFVNEAFPDSHREHASIVGVPKFLPSFAGLRFAQEVKEVSKALTPPENSIAVVGGAKFETKVPLILKLLSLYSHVLVGGALGNDLIKARGLPFGKSLISETPVPPEIAGDERVLMPQDAVFAEVGSNAERTSFVPDIRANESIIDIGPQTATLWGEMLGRAPFVLWNGPMGLYEQGYNDGTDALASTIASSEVQAVVGGGDTAAALTKVTFDPKKVFISTGGGAMLEFIANGTLPGIEALKK
jgi:phosphoglycerate kinase